MSAGKRNQRGPGVVQHQTYLVTTNIIPFKLKGQLSTNGGQHEKLSKRAVV